MNALLIRVGADQTAGGCNGLVDSQTLEFVYIPIPESCDTHDHLAKPYSLFGEAIQQFGESLPSHLTGRNTHLDPDFEYLTYGDQGGRAVQITSYLEPGDLVAFYAGLRDIRPNERLVYAIIGLYVIEEIIDARLIPENRWHENAHTRRRLAAGDIIIRAKRGISGRLERCLPIGSYRPPAGDPGKRPSYRVSSDLLNIWGGFNVRDGFIQRSARLPQFLNADLFYQWFQKQGVSLIERNN
ncbi:MAG: hypothetical protein Q8P24_16490 [Desulfobacterales bacterium]|nr:hypothetical protein [Desulfobacterales bacterium]